MEKHTPGPWEVREIAPEGAGNSHVLMSPKGRITKLYLTYHGMPQSELDIANANAKLMAASPTMYKELSRIAEVPLVGEAGYRKLDNSDAQGFIRIARAAISKATD